MRTRRTQYTHLEILRSPEIQLQIAKDAKLARRIGNRFHSPIKKSNKKDNKKTNNPLERTRKSAATRRLDFGVVKEGQAQQDGSSYASRRLALGVSEVAAATPAHFRVASDSESEDEAKEASDPENWAGVAAPGSYSKRLRSLFKHRVEAQDADKDSEDLIQDGVILDSKESMDVMNANIAQSVPPHLRQKFAAATVASIRRLEWVSDRQMIGEVSDTMRELLRKPQRAQAAPRP
jgi:hypothetical protein